MIGSVVFTFGLQLMTLYIPSFNKLFHTEPLTLKELLICIGVAALIFPAVEIEKLLRSRRRQG